MADVIEEFLAQFPPEMQAISRKLRAMVQAAMPQAKEVLFAQDNHFDYLLGDSSRNWIVYICPMKQYVRLGFMRGTQLPDPEHVLVGEGQWMRHVKVRTVQQADDPVLEALTRAAWEYAASTMSKAK